MQFRRYSAIIVTVEWRNAAAIAKLVSRYRSMAFIMVVARKPPSPTKPVINEDEAMRFINGASGDPPLAPAAVAVEFLLVDAVPEPCSQDET